MYINSLPHFLLFICLLDNEEEQQDEDHTIAAATCTDGSNNQWKVLIIAAIVNSLFICSPALLFLSKREIHRVHFGSYMNFLYLISLCALFF